ncbi:aromatic amino acid transaminase [Advenella sp. RU8]|uniref:amino acid aminotransferase n=1 Tax=Advenella sp. RU8 TaxID=3399575 RepID=UPI003AADFCA4
MFEHLAPYAGDPIFRIGDMFRQDQRQNKVDLTVGLYYDGKGQIPVLNSIHQAELKRAQQPETRQYLPMEGLASYRSAVQKLLFGTECAALEEGRIVTMQSVGGTGALRIGGELLHLASPNSEIWISNPGWDNHHSIFEGAGLKTHTYPYYDSVNGVLLFDEMKQTLQTIPAGSIVLLHPCCHNPTGADLSTAQWEEIADILVEHKLIPFLDIAYQGFSNGLDEDAFAIRLLASRNIPMLVANSFSKNFSFYAERCGALSVVCQNTLEADRVLGQIKLLVRRIYSNPPLHGARMISDVLNDPELFAMWDSEVNEMRTRIRNIRQKAYDILKAQAPHFDSSFIIKQNGMFSYTGLSLPQIEKLRADYGVYFIDSGRISVPGLNEDNVTYFAESVSKVV